MLCFIGATSKVRPQLKEWKHLWGRTVTGIRHSRIPWLAACFIHLTFQNMNTYQGGGVTVQPGHASHPWPAHAGHEESWCKLIKSGSLLLSRNFSAKKERWLLFISLSYQYLPAWSSPFKTDRLMALSMSVQHSLDLFFRQWFNGAQVGGY